MNTPRAVGRNGSHLDFKFFYSVRLGVRIPAIADRCSG
jgi:hypothetical protein